MKRKWVSPFLIDQLEFIICESNSHWLTWVIMVEDCSRETRLHTPLREPDRQYGEEGEKRSREGTFLGPLHIPIEIFFP